MLLIDYTVSCGGFQEEEEAKRATASNRKQAMQLAEQDLVSIVSSADTIELVLIQVTVFLA